MVVVQNQKKIVKKVVVKKPSDEQQLKPIARKIPKELFPRGRLIADLMGIVFIIGLLWGVFGTPFTDVFSGSGVAINLGYPFSFFELGPDNIGKFPVNLWNLFFDLLIYFVIAYILAVTWTILTKSFRKDKKVVEEKNSRKVDVRPKVVAK